MFVNCKQSSYLVKLVIYKKFLFSVLSNWFGKYLRVSDQHYSPPVRGIAVYYSPPPRGIVVQYNVVNAMRAVIGRCL